MNGVDVVVHAAALKQVPACEYNPIEAVLTNVMGARNIIEAALDCNVGSVLALSTDKAVGPANLYGATKLAQEHILRTWTVSFAVGAAVLRLQNVYGPGQSLCNPYTGIVPLFAQLARAGERIPLYEDGEVTRDFVFVEDAARAICRAACDGTPSDFPYDIGSGEATSIRSWRP